MPAAVWLAGWLQAGLAIALVVGLKVTGLTLEWSGALLPAIPIAFMLTIWAVLTFSQPNRLEQAIADVCGALALLILLGFFSGPLQYVAIGLGRPFADPWLVSVDAALGVSVQTTAAWLWEHLTIARWFTWGYATLWWQLVLIVPLLVILRQREALWEYVAVFHLATVVTVLCAALWPAEGPFTAMHFNSPLIQDPFIQQLAALRAGTIGPLRYGEFQGMITFPSFHFASGLMVTWSLRRTPWIWPAIGLNLLLAGGTFLTGAHYVTDGIGTIAMLALAYGVYAKAGASQD